MNLANQLTVGRLVLAGLMFAALQLAAPGYALLDLGDPAQRRTMLLNVALVLFVVAALTDVADGWIARKYDMTSDFGRVADPFCDKVMTCGAFVFLSTLPSELDGQRVVVPAWVTVMILAREFLVTGLRGFIESRGRAFGAMIWGKLKTFVQCVTIGFSLFALGNLPRVDWAWVLARGLVWATLGVTLLSGAAYLVAARRLIGDGLEGQ